MKNSNTRVLAVCSGGGHRMQMKRLLPALQGCETVLASVSPIEDDRIQRFYSILDANRDTKLRMLGLLIRMFFVVIWTRPDAIVSTGAAPGYLAIRVGKLIGARTLFVDSIANGTEPSLSAKLSMAHADVTLSQWPEVSEKYGTSYWGAIL